MTNARKLYKDIRPIGIALLFSLIAAALSACGAPASTQATSCENLSSVKLEHAVISSARAVSAGCALERQGQYGRRGELYLFVGKLRIL